MLLDPQIIEDVISIAQLLVYLEEQLSENFSLFFEREMADLKSPDIIMDELLARIKAEMDCQVSNLKTDFKSKRDRSIFSSSIFGAELLYEKNNPAYYSKIQNWIIFFGLFFF